MSKHKNHSKNTVSPKSVFRSPSTEEILQKSGQNVPKESFFSSGAGKGLVILLLVIASFIAFSGGFKNQFVDWDDHVYIENNYLVTQPQGHWGEAFKTHVALNYHPFTVISMMMNASVSGSENPGSFILTNFFIHVLNSILVFLLVSLLVPGKRMVPLFTALLFAVHPMRVESVTWISERKDVLYGFFFLLAGINYLVYLNSGRKVKYLILTFLLFFCSCMSKGQAVVLPLVLLLFDYWMGRKIESKAIVEKIPFLIVSLVFGLIAVNIQSGGDFHGMIQLVGEQRSALSVRAFTLFERLQYAGYGFMMYCWHLFFPFKLGAFYPYEAVGPNYKMYPIGLVFMILVLIATAFSFKKSRLFVFAIGFFTITIALVLQIVSVGAAIMADRYTYIPYIGLFFLFTMLLESLVEKSAVYTKMVWAVLSLFVVFCIFQTRKQVKIWENTGTLFSRNIELYPNDPRSYYTRGKYIGEKEGKLDESIADNLKAIELGYKDDSGPWENLGTAYGIKGDAKKAAEYFSMAIEKGAKSGETYMNRGIAYFNLSQPEKAIPDFEKALTMKNSKSTFTRGFLAAAQLNSGHAQSALENFNIVIDKEGGMDAIYFYNRGLTKNQLGDRAGAIRDIQKALQIQPDYNEAKQALKLLGAV
ncbi:Tetratricopeptide repeat-containing protein [Pseudarcicella hirudinis]|uniref:Tetratricopeptide repeat-containing protein n=1 Tax=Pseudarcicella hirudinis TaxID=1079859 RepID=A0A1I5Q7Z5_9BACT|nr:tetratricopeptide repeat protein [Pseudarcicella hirudinis]SFP42131.1 Tetratricopeptide repeat-containing protein [Pseudarcicella hirudinis]